MSSQVLRNGDRKWVLGLYSGGEIVDSGAEGAGEEGHRAWGPRRAPSWTPGRFCTTSHLRDSANGSVGAILWVPGPMPQRVWASEHPAGAPRGTRLTFPPLPCSVSHQTGLPNCDLSAASEEHGCKAPRYGFSMALGRKRGSRTVRHFCIVRHGGIIEKRCAAVLPRAKRGTWSSASEVSPARPAASAVDGVRERSSRVVLSRVPYRGTRKKLSC